MKCYIPEISWHNKDPVLSIDFQVCQGALRRVASGGTDAHVVIWLVTISEDENQPVRLEVAADLNRHTKTVNVVRFSPNGELLASGDDEAAIIIWKQQEKDTDALFNDDSSENREQWLPLKILRNHIDDVCDLCWSLDSSVLISGSVDNTAILWDVQKGKNIAILSEHKGFVQGVALDSQGQYAATISSDRILRIYNMSTKKILHRVHKTALPANSIQEGNKTSKLFYDDTLKSFCRRLRFSPDGEFLVVPSGIQEIKEGELCNGVYIFSHHNLSKPCLWLPTGSKYTIAVCFCPILFELRCVPNGKRPDREEVNSEADAQNNQVNKNQWEKWSTLFCLPYRVVFAVATQDSILIYDTQQTFPIAYISNIHYTRLSDIAWSSDGRILMASSTDGYCSFITFADGELGVPYVKERENNEASIVSIPTSLDDKQPLVSNSQAIVPDDHLPETAVPVPSSLPNATSSTTESLSRVSRGTKDDDHMDIDTSDMEKVKENVIASKILDTGISCTTAASASKDTSCEQEILNEKQTSDSAKSKINSEVPERTEDDDHFGLDGAMIANKDKSSKSPSPASKSPVKADVQDMALLSNEEQENKPRELDLSKSEEAEHPAQLETSNEDWNLQLELSSELPEKPSSLDKKEDDSAVSFKGTCATGSGPSSGPIVNRPPRRVQLITLSGSKANKN